MDKSIDLLCDAVWSTRHEWVRWLMGEDAQTLLWQLCELVEHPDLSREDLTRKVAGWQANARKAVGARAWTVRVDPALGVCLDPRLYTFDMRMRAWSE